LSRQPYSLHFVLWTRTGPHDVSTLSYRKKSSSGGMKGPRFRSQLSSPSVYDWQGAAPRYRAQTCSPLHTIGALPPLAALTVPKVEYSESGREGVEGVGVRGAEN
jgi:hypothetical protein